MKERKLKGVHIVGLIIFLLVIDQALKFYIKTNYYLGEEHRVIGHWFRLHFVENEGMAWGLKFGGAFGKIALTLFRLAAVIWGSFFLAKLIKKQYRTGFIICISMIYAGAAGNLIDSLFYGLIFNGSNPDLQNVAHFLPKHGGYAHFLHGRVVDMLYFPIVDTVLPNWVPFMGGKEFTFFDPVFNLADFYISLSFFILIIFQKRYLSQPRDSKSSEQADAFSNDDKGELSSSSQNEANSTTS